MSLGFIREFQRNQKIAAEAKQTRQNMKYRKAGEIWSDDEIARAERMLYDGPAPAIPQRSVGAGRDGLRIIPGRSREQGWYNLSNNPLLKQAAKEMKQMGEGGFDEVTNDKELAMVVDYIRNIGQKSDKPKQEVVNKIEEKPIELPEHSTDYIQAKEENKKYKNDLYSGKQLKTKNSWDKQYDQTPDDFLSTYKIDLIADDKKRKADKLNEELA